MLTNYVHSQALDLLRVIRFITYVDSLQVLYLTLIYSKLEYASVVWNILASAENI
jgi:hypothetical protein